MRESSLNRLHPTFPTPAVAVALAIAGLPLSGAVAAKNDPRADDIAKVSRDAILGHDALPRPLQLAPRLTALESFIGIRADPFAACHPRNGA